MKPAIYIGNLKNPSNRGTCIRTGEAFGINLILTDDKIKKYKYSQGTSNHVTFLTEMSEEDVIDYARENNHKIVAIEDTEGAFDMDKANYPANPLFVTGHENDGVSKVLLQNARMIIKIPQGNTYCRCLNTSVACSIIIQDWFNKNKKKQIQTKNDNQKHGGVNSAESEPTIKQEIKQEIDKGYDKTYDKIDPKTNDFVLSKKVVGK
jgi:tRNA G18 (ribose-2'-O)-methylase SpoU